MKTNEVLQAARLKVDLEEARFLALTRTQHPAVVADTFGEVITEISELLLMGGKTQEFRSALNDLINETFEARALWETARQNSPTGSSEVSSDA